MATAKHKKGKKHKSKHENAGEGMAPGTEAAHPETDQPRMSAKEFNKALKPLQVELVKLQAWVKATGAKVVSYSKAAMPPARAERSSASGTGSARESSPSLRCPHRRSGRSRKCIFSATCHT